MSASRTLPPSPSGYVAVSRRFCSRGASLSLPWPLFQRRRRPLQGLLRAALAAWTRLSSSTGQPLDNHQQFSPARYCSALRLLRELQDARLARSQLARSALPVRPLPPALLAPPDRLAADAPSLPGSAAGPARERTSSTLRAARLLGLSEATKVSWAGAEGRPDQAWGRRGREAEGGCEACT